MKAFRPIVAAVFLFDPKIYIPATHVAILPGIENLIQSRRIKGAFLVTCVLKLFTVL